MLSVNTVAVRGLLSALFIDSIVSNALIMASCSAWLFEHLLSSLSFIRAAISCPMKITAPDPTPVSHILPSV